MAKSLLSKFKKDRGFTIIEVALVLAVAGLIFLVVFLAVPALQRNQRDDARKRDVSNIIGAIGAWSANNPGKRLGTGGNTVGYLDGAITGALVGYFDGFSNSISGINIADLPTSVTTARDIVAGDGATTDTIKVFAGAKCVGVSQIQSASARQYAIIVQLEAGDAFYCQGV